MELPSDVADLVQFAAVVQAASFTEAGRLLHMSTCVLSRTVSRLEERLGVTLLARSTRQLRLTEVGKHVYEHCQRLLAEAQAVRNVVAEHQERPSGSLRVNAPLTFGLLHLAPLVPRFMTRYPDVKVDISFSDRYVDLDAKDYDVAVRICRNDDDNRLKGRRLARDRRVLCASPDYFRRCGKPGSPEDLTEHNCLLYTHDLDQPAREEWWFQRDGHQFSVEVAGNFRTDTGEPLRQAALQGLGIVQMPCFLAGEDLKKGALELVLPEYEYINRALFAVYPEAKYYAQKLTVFLDFLVEQIGRTPYWEP